MNIPPLLVRSQQPLWLRLLVALAAVIISWACTDHRYHLQTFLAWFAAYLVLTGIPWLIVRRLPLEHPVRILQIEHEQMARRFYSYRGREFFCVGFGLLLALFLAHGFSRGEHAGPYIVGGLYLVMGLCSMIYWQWKHARAQVPTAPRP